MTDLQKLIVEALLKGATITQHGTNFRLVDFHKNPLRSFSLNTFKLIHVYIKKHKGRFVIDKLALRKANGNSFVKKAYKKSLAVSKSTNHIFDKTKN